MSICLQMDHTADSPEPPTEASEPDAGVGVDTLMQRMKSLSEHTEEFTAEERAKRFERVELQSVELGTSAGPKVKPSIGHFVDDPGFIYEDFARRGEISSIPTFRVQVKLLILKLIIQVKCTWWQHQIQQRNMQYF